MSDPTLPNPLVVDVDEVAKRCGLDLPIDSGTSDTIRYAILDAQADVVSYLNRPIVPEVRTARGVWPARFGGYFGPFEDGRRLHDGWAIDDDDCTSVISATPEVDPVTGRDRGTFTLTYWAGLDARNDPTLSPIVRFVAAAAMNTPMVLDLWVSLRPRGQLISVSTDGQTATYNRAWHGEGTMPGSGAPGVLPTITSLYPWKKAPVFQRRTPADWWWV